jgi:WD40 repeat protein
VRSLIWNYELPWLLISGGDDSRLAAWDIRNDKLLYETVEPCISVSSIANNPKSLSLVTSHLDNSVIFWDLMGIQDIFIAQMKSILGLELREITSPDVNDVMLPSTCGKLAGGAT